MLKNTDDEYEIVEKRETLKKSLKEGVIVFSLMSVLITGVVTYSNIHNNTQSQTTQFVTEEHDNSNRVVHEGGYEDYFNEYFGALEKYSDQSFDLNFKAICSKKTCNVNGNEYLLNELYVIKSDNGKVYLVKAGENNFDIISNEKFNNKEIIIMNLSEALPFYKMYNDGIFNKNDSLSIDSKIFNKYFIDWNGETHLKTLDQVAYNEAVKGYIKKYGG